VKVLTEDQLAEVDRIINNSIVTTWETNGEDSIEVDDAKGSLRFAAREVREYLSKLEVKEVANAGS
jgi:hypothetical protein